MSRSSNNKSPSLLLPTVCTVALLLASCTTKPHTLSSSSLNQLPHVILWAWERPEDLEFLDTERYGVAFLAQTLILQEDEVIFRPRRQPLKVSPGAKLIAVTRIESLKTTGKRAAMSNRQKEQLLKLVLKTLQLDKVLAIQIDFDAAASERDFYSHFLKDLRAQLPETVPLSMTALASFCIGDRWLDDLPVDEAVPMIFRMGADDKAIKNSLANGDDFREPLCRRSYGVSIDEPLEMKMDRTRRLYVFTDHVWTEKDLASLPGVFR